jgi:hypothetical protein
MAAREVASARTGRPARGASASASTPPSAQRASQCSPRATARPLPRAMRSTSSPSAAAWTISSRSRIRRVRSVRRSSRSTSSRCFDVTVIPMAPLLPSQRADPKPAPLPAASSFLTQFSSGYLGAAISHRRAHLGHRHFARVHAGASLWPASRRCRSIEVAPPTRRQSRAVMVGYGAVWRVAPEPGPERREGMERRHGAVGAESRARSRGRGVAGAERKAQEYGHADSRWRGTE